MIMYVLILYEFHTPTKSIIPILVFTVWCLSLKIVNDNVIVNVITADYDTV